MIVVNAATPTISTDAGEPRPPVDPSAAVIELARTAARQDAGDPALIGDFAGAGSEDDVAITVRFATTDVAYTGWAWCVTVALVDPEHPTISEVVLLPGPDSLLPPAWLPWRERIRPGDLGPGDLLLPPTEDDPRLVPAYVRSDDPAVEDVAHELGIGRVRVMSRAGRTDTAERWFDGGFGPTADMAKQAPQHCVLCAFFLPLAGSLGARFGACGNEMSPADGRVVDAGYGCGAHSELVIEPVPTGFRPSHIDDTVLDVHPRGLAESAEAFLGDDDSELEIRPTHDAPAAGRPGPTMRWTVTRWTVTRWTMRWPTMRVGRRCGGRRCGGRGRDGRAGRSGTRGARRRRCRCRWSTPTPTPIRSRPSPRTLPWTRNWPRPRWTRPRRLRWRSRRSRSRRATISRSRRMRLRALEESPVEVAVGRRSAFFAG